MGPGSFDLYTLGWSLVLQPMPLVLLVAGVFLGIVFGAMPGLTANMGVAILVPFTYALSPTAAILMLIGVYCGAVYGGSISATLINIPGTPAALMTVFDAYPMAQRGEAGRALGLATTASFIGGLLSVVALAVFAPVIARTASTFRSQEYFAFAVLGLSVVAYVSGSNLVRGLASGLFGLFVACIGVDLATGYPRFLMGMPNLLSGVEFVPILIGLFGLSEVLEQVYSGSYKKTPTQKLQRILPSIQEFATHVWTVIRSAIIGVFIGALPGAGATIAAIVAYGQQKRFSKNPDELGKGAPDGIIAAETANNACTGGAMITMLSLGIPGDSVTAILIGALILHGIRPGPLLFSQEPALVSSIFIGMFLANCVMFVLGICGARLFARLISLSKAILLPTVVVLAAVGAYAIRNNPFDVGVMITFGFVGFLMERLSIPKAPMVLGIILGPLMEVNLRRAFQLNRGSYWATVNSFVKSPTALGILIFSIVILLLPWLQRRLAGRKHLGSA
ncbi:MAG: C4-dicarboxylate ABC transporter permease [Firmicutes bacterium]|nr:C4-dicarboxylate ABC transporter permease [Bacillota bacterium]